MSKSHEMMMLEYWAYVESYKQELERATAMYDTEVKEYKEKNPQVTFKQWLQQYNK